MLVSLVAGRAAEEIVFDTVTTGAANDIEKATGIARSMVTQYGMSKRFGLVGLSTVESKYLEGREVLNCSDKTAAEVDEEVVAILKESYEKAKKLLSENRELMNKLAAFLIEKETITGKEFMEIYRREKGLPEPEDETRDEASAEKTATAETDGETAEKAVTAEADGETAEKAVTAEADRETAEKAATAETTAEPAGESTEEAAGEPGEREPASAPADAPGQAEDRSVGVFSNHVLNDDK